MGNLQVRYPFINDSTYILPNNDFNDASNIKLFTGENNIGSKYGVYSYSYGTYRTVVTVTYAPNFSIGDNFTWGMSCSADGYGGLWVAHGSQMMFSYNSSLSNSIHGRDYTKIPFYSYETNSTYLFATDNLNNFFLLTERRNIDDPAAKELSIFTRKIMDTGDNTPLGLYEYNANGLVSSETHSTNFYSKDKLYNACNVGYCSTYSLYQYTRDGFIYPDIYYCDGGLSVPSDGIIRIGTSRFMKLGSNIFLRMD